MKQLDNFKAYKSCSSPIAYGFQGPNIDIIEFQRYYKIEKALSDIKNGELDILDFPMLVNNEKYETRQIMEFECEVFGFYFLGLNHNNELLKQQEVRKAIAYIINYSKKCILKDYSLEYMDSIAADIYGKIINPFVIKYNSKSAAEAIEKCNSLLKRFDIESSDPVPFYYDVDDSIASEIAIAFQELLNKTGLKNKIFTEPISVSSLLKKIYLHESTEWGGFIYFNHIMDNITSWKPGMFKTRYTPTFLGDFMSNYSCLRNFSGLKNKDYDDAAYKLFTVLVPYDIRPAVLTDGYLSSQWANEEFWAKDEKKEKEPSALFYAWKLQWIISNELPMIPLFMPKFKFIGNNSIKDVWNGFDKNSTHHGGVLSYWTFQKIKSENNKIKIGLSGELLNLNPLKGTTYRDTLVWTRIYESLISLNPYLISKGVAEDACHLASLYNSEICDDDENEYKQKLTFEIKPNISWHDGQKFKIQDVAFTILSVLGEQGHTIADKHESTKSLIPLLTNKVKIPAWSDYYKYLHHIEIENEFTIAFYLTDHFRWAHEWFGDIPILPSHLWSNFGSDFLNPQINGIEGLTNIPNGLIGCGPFKWSHLNNDLKENVILEKNRNYHNKKADYVEVSDIQEYITETVKGKILEGD